MPEQISKYPDVTLQVLKGAGAVCGEGADQRILTRCPADRFCAFPTGEICVYGLEDIPSMTQISRQELAKVVCPSRASMFPSVSSATDGIVLGVVLVLGFTIGRLWQARAKRVKK